MESSMSPIIKHSNSIIAKGINWNLICIYLNTFYLGARTPALANESEQRIQKGVNTGIRMFKNIHKHLPQCSQGQIQMLINILIGIPRFTEIWAANTITRLLEQQLQVWWENNRPTLQDYG